ncbi:MAG TPA: LysM peptidoglycan-binding domain-containing protein [Porticoccaceae bacterium]|nr:LysM peptidoglycan-binding domain-containing protein [Porticoccaceae bacterium]HIK80598.1 LysM peptidoglycan-binding domain-containing protein [Porticoccaceae bacterium]
MKAHRSLFIYFLFLSSLVTAVGQDVVAAKLESDLIKETARQQYTVVKGDTLWDISGQFLKHPWKWPEIWHENAQIENPHLIYPGDLIILQFVGGAPRLTLVRNRKLSPEIKYLPHVSANEVVPLAVINRFLTYAQFRSFSEVNTAPSILSGAEDQMLIGLNDEFYTLATMQDAEYGVFRQEDDYLDPITRDVLGVRLSHLGEAHLARQDEGIATLKAISAKQAFPRGDKILGTQQTILLEKISPKAPVQSIEGHVVAVENMTLFAGQMDIIAINKSKQSGVQVGDILNIFSPGKAVQDDQGSLTVQLLDRRIGLAVILSIYKKMAYAIVMKAVSPVQAGDILKSPED